MKKTILKIIGWFEEQRADNRLYKKEHPFPEYSHRKLALLEAVLGWVWGLICELFWFLVLNIKSRCK